MANGDARKKVHAQRKEWRSRTMGSGWGARRTVGAKQTAKFSGVIFVCSEFCAISFKKLKSVVEAVLSSGEKLLLTTDVRALGISTALSAPFPASMIAS